MPFYKVSPGPFNKANNLVNISLPDGTEIQAKRYDNEEYGTITLISPELQPEHIDTRNDVVKIDNYLVILPELDNYRYVTYGTKIYHIRNTESFFEYHKKNPNKLEDILTDMFYAVNHLTEGQLKSIYLSAGAANNHHSLLHYQSTSYLTISAVPFKPMLQFSLRWLQGLVIAAYGAKGLDIIKAAKQKAEDKMNATKEKVKGAQKKIIQGMLDRMRESTQQELGRNVEEETSIDIMQLDMANAMHKVVFNQVSQYIKLK